MQIEATEYTRQDGMRMIKLHTGKWVIRKTFGPTWFYSDSQSKWIIGTSFIRSSDLEKEGMPFDRAMELLNQLPELT
jgi:hypothetical protein